MLPPIAVITFAFDGLMGLVGTRSGFWGLVERCCQGWAVVGWWPPGCPQISYPCSGPELGPPGR